MAGQDHRPGRAAGDHRAALVRRGQGTTHGAAVEHAHQIRGLAARQVDEVGLADRLGGSRVVGARTIADEDRLDLGARAPRNAETPIVAHRRKISSPSGYEAVGRSRPEAGRAGRDEQAGIELGHRGKELSGADERHGSGHRRRVYAPCPNPGGAATLAAMTSRQRWTLICTVIGSGAVFLDGTIVNAALKHIGQELPGSVIGVLEGQAYIVGGYLAVLAALLILSGALSDHYGRRRVYAIGLIGFARHLRAVRPRPDPRSRWSSSGSPRAPRGPCSSPVRWRSSRTRSTARSGRARSGSGRPPRRRSSSPEPIVGGVIVDTIGWRFAFLINVPLLASRCGRP